MDGEITIGTKLSTDKFDKQISDLEKKMKKEEDKKIVIDAKLGSQQEELDKARQKTDALADAYQRLKEVQDRLATKQATPKEFTTFQDLQNTYGSLEKLGSEFDKALTKQNAIEQKVAQTKYRYDEINTRVSEYKQKIENVKIQRQVADVEKLKSAFNSVGSSIQKSIKNVAKLALGIFGLRSAYMALRRASSDLASYDEQYATNLEYIRFVLTQAIAPILRAIVDLAMKLLGLINMIAQAWFGVNLFSSGSAENFKKMKSSAGGVSKAVKEIKKQLAGFDEINILTDQSDTGTSAGAGGVGVPSFDLSSIQGEVPEWMEWILEHKDAIISALAGIAGALLASKISKLLKNLGLIKKGLKAIKVLGIGLMIAGIVKAIISLLDYLKAPTWENFGKIIEGIGIAIIGLGAIIGSLPVAIAGAITLIVGMVIKNWDKIKDILQKGINWLTDKSDWVHKMFGDTIGNIYDFFVSTLQSMLNWFDIAFTNIKRIFDGFIQFFKGVFTGNWKQAWEGLKQIFEGVWNIIRGTLQIFWNWLYSNLVQPVWNGISNLLNSIKNLFINVWNGIINALSSVASWIYNNIVKPVSSSLNGLWNGFKTGAVNAWNGIKSVFSNVANFFRTTFSNAWNAVKKVFSVGGRVFDGIKEGIVSAFKNIVNGLIRGINKIVSIPFNSLNNALQKIRNIEIFGQTPFGFMPRISVPQIPYLKVGGIINMPNKGTMLGSAIGGESGKEGVIPLTDQQAMAELGAEIGRNVVVNLTNITKVGNRQIAREIKQINAEQEFAFNS